jgi:hypothetical protein
MSTRRKRGIASNPLFIGPEFFLHFPNKLSYGYLRFEGNGTSQKKFPISFNPKVAMAEFFWKIQRIWWYSILGVEAMPFFLKNLLLSRPRSN